MIATKIVSLMLGIGGFILMQIDGLQWGEFGLTGLVVGAVIFMFYQFQKFQIANHEKLTEAYRVIAESQAGLIDSQKDLQDSTVKGFEKVESRLEMIEKKLSEK